MGKLVDEIMVHTKLHKVEKRYLIISGTAWSAGGFITVAVAVHVASWIRPRWMPAEALAPHRPWQRRQRPPGRPQTAVLRQNIHA